MYGHRLSGPRSGPARDAAEQQRLQFVEWLHRYGWGSRDQAATEKCTERETGIQAAVIAQSNADLRNRVGDIETKLRSHDNRLDKVEGKIDTGFTLQESNFQKMMAALSNVQSGIDTDTAQRKRSRDADNIAAPPGLQPGAEGVGTAPSYQPGAVAAVSPPLDQQ